MDAGLNTLLHVSTCTPNGRHDRTTLADEFRDAALVYRGTGERHRQAPHASPAHRETHDALNVDADAMPWHQ